MVKNQLSKEEESLFQLVTEDKTDEVKKILIDHKIDPNLYNEDRITLLQHACFKGNLELVKLLLDLGADVNFTVHQNLYTPLHFAALSGKPEICVMLLAAGAKLGTMNSVQRTASHLASFVGNHDSVAAMNNFLPKSEVKYFTRPHGLESKPKLSPNLCDPLYDYILLINLHPVRLAVGMPKVLLDNSNEVKQVMDLLVEREMKRGAATNEALALKLHLLAFVLAELAKYKGREEMGPVELFSRKILNPDTGEEYLEKFIREMLRRFPFRDGILFQQMVKFLARKDDYPALYTLLGAINGNRGFVPGDNYCKTCLNPRASRRCSKCKNVLYCDRECQRLHWFVHKKECKDKPASGQTEVDTSGIEGSNFKLNIE